MKDVTLVRNPSHVKFVTKNSQIQVIQKNMKEFTLVKNFMPVNIAEKDSTTLQL